MTNARCSVLHRDQYALLITLNAPKIAVRHCHSREQRQQCLCRRPHDRDRGRLGASQVVRQLPLRYASFMTTPPDD